MNLKTFNIGKIAYLAIGHITFGIGFVAIFIPGLPTVPLWLIACWAYSKSSPALEQKLLHHPHFGPYLKAWRNHRVIPQKAKIFITIFMAVSFCILIALSTPLLILSITGSCMALVLFYIYSKPSTYTTNDKVQS